MIASKNVQALVGIVQVHLRQQRCGIQMMDLSRIAFVKLIATGFKGIVFLTPKFGRSPELHSVLCGIGCEDCYPVLPVLFAYEVMIHNHILDPVGLEETVHRFRKVFQFSLTLFGIHLIPVSYTHLTLPTN